MAMLTRVNSQARPFSPGPITDAEAAAMFRAVINLFRLWGVSDDQAATLLDLNRRTCARWKAGELGRIGRVGHRIHGDRTTRVRGIGWEYVHVAIDDCTRLAYAEVLADETKATTAAFLTRTLRYFRRRGIPISRVLTDNGGAYRSRDFAAVIAAQQLRHLRTRPYTPRTHTYTHTHMHTRKDATAQGRKTAPAGGHKKHHQALS